MPASDASALTFGASRWLTHNEGWETTPLRGQVDKLLDFLLAEDDQATLCAARGTWGDPQGREMLAFQRDRWHRAYLTRMLAESRTGSVKHFVKHALVAYARAALDEYRTRGFPDSVAVLDAYFAALDGKRGAALDAARRVDPAKDDDMEDLYLVVVPRSRGRSPGRGSRPARNAPCRRRAHLARDHVALAGPRREVAGVHALARRSALKPRRGAASATPWCPESCRHASCGFAGVVAE
jgi:hypothetical protein